WTERRLYLRMCDVTHWDMGFHGDAVAVLPTFLSLLCLCSFLALRFSLLLPLCLSALSRPLSFSPSLPVSYSSPHSLPPFLSASSISLSLLLLFCSSSFLLKRA